MSGTVILLVAGVVLIAVGALGGMAGAGRTLRVAAASGGVLCVVAGAILTTSDDCSSEGNPLEIAILNQLGDGQVSERIHVFFDGRDAGVVTVDRKSPMARMPVTLSGTCGHRYRLEIRRQREGQPPATSVSTGTVAVKRGDSLYVLADPSNPKGQTYLATELP